MLMLPLLPLLTLCKPAAAAGLPPVADCASLADANLGPNVTVLSAAEVDGAWAAGGSQQQAGQAAAGGGTCTFVDGVDVGEPSTVVTSFKGAGWVDQDKCCTACYANPKCGVAIVLDSSHKGLAGCWLKTGAGATQKKLGATSCKTTRPAPKQSHYCLVKVLAMPAINIWVGLPSDGSYNDRFMALGGGGEPTQRDTVAFPQRTPPRPAPNTQTHTITADRCARLRRLRRQCRRADKSSAARLRRRDNGHRAHRRLRQLRDGKPTSCRRDCHCAAPPSPSSRCFNGGGEGVSAE